MTTNSQFYLTLEPCTTNLKTTELIQKPHSRASPTDHRLQTTLEERVLRKLETTDRKLLRMQTIRLTTSLTHLIDQWLLDSMILEMFLLITGQRYHCDPQIPQGKFLQDIETEEKSWNLEERVIHIVYKWLRFSFIYIRFEYFIKCYYQGT